MELNPKLRKRLRILGIGSGILGIVILIGIFTSREDTKSVKKEEKEKVTVLREADLERERWRASAEKEIDELKRVQKEILEKLKSLEEKVSKKEEKELPLPPPPPSSPKDIFSPPPPPPPPSIRSGGKEASQIRVFKPETSLPNSPQSRPQATPEPNALKGNWIPSGSFIKGVMLSGLDAPTGVQSRTNPHPVLIRLKEPANLPNLKRLDVRECFVTGGGYGDLASERAYIRLETLSCVLKSGRVIDTQIKGYVAGEDGKVGLRGRLVSKQGQVLSRAILAGFAGGIGEAFSSIGTATTIGAGGTVTVGPQGLGDIGIAAGGRGISRAMEKLADYYMKLADQLFPVIEVDSGRTVDVVVLEGKELTPRDTLASQTQNTESRKTSSEEGVNNLEKFQEDIKRQREEIQ